MLRFRILAGLLGCLAILAGGFASVAAATTIHPVVADRGTADAPPCSHCDDCKGVPCPTPTAACLQALSNAAPVIVASTFDLPVVDFRTMQWPLRTDTLSGLSPPPDPFPPRT